MALDLTTQNLLQEGLQSLPLQIDSRVLDAELLLAHSLGTERSRIRSHPETTRTAQERVRVFAGIYYELPIRMPAAKTSTPPRTT